MYCESLPTVPTLLFIIRAMREERSCVHKGCVDFLSSLNQRDDLDLIEEYERRESGEHVLLEDGGRGQDDVLDVLHAVRLVDLGEELGVVDLDDLVQGN